MGVADAGIVPGIAELITPSVLFAGVLGILREHPEPAVWIVFSLVYIGFLAGMWVFWKGH